MSNNKNLILSCLVGHKSTVDLEGGILGVILLNYKKLFSELYYQSIVMRGKSFEERESCLHTVLGSRKRVQVKQNI